VKAQLAQARAEAEIERLTRKPAVASPVRKEVKPQAPQLVRSGEQCEWDRFLDLVIEDGPIMIPAYGIAKAGRALTDNVLTGGGTVEELGPQGVWPIPGTQNKRHR
jgi:hypothetical protein